MSREIRRVPENWEHPVNDAGHLDPLHGYSFKKSLAEWLKENDKWTEGLCRSYKEADGETQHYEPNDACDSETYEEYAGDKPVESDYMPEWDEDLLTHIMMYETCTEGTPLSPAFKTPEELARWLADNGASAFGYQTATYDQWLATCKIGWAPSAIGDANGIRSGVEASADN